eukprot:scaffold19825_cov103-Isochrysis_galbana.AAC.7
MAKGNKSGRAKPRLAALEGPPEELHGKAEDAKAAQTVEVAQAAEVRSGRPQLRSLACRA